MKTTAVALMILLASACLSMAADRPFMTTGARTTQPIGHFDFCKKFDTECSGWSMTPSAERPNRMKLLESVNLEVNAAVKPLSDQEHHGRKEVWSFPDDGKGDCEDYALLKRRKLIAAGIHKGNLLMSVADKPDGERHAVLTVRMADGDYVLDNLRGDVVRWDRTGYTFVKRQSENNPGRWIDIRDGVEAPDTAIASASVQKEPRTP